MGFLKKIFSREKEEKQEEPQAPSRSINPNAPMYQNELICNACGNVIEGTPKFFNFQGKKMIFHKGCFKKLKNGNIQIK